jgi:hypothetical protein
MKALSHHEHTAPDFVQRRHRIVLALEPEKSVLERERENLTPHRVLPCPSTRCSYAALRALPCGLLLSRIELFPVSSR